MLKFLPQILIFASLGVIIYIFGRKIPQLRELSRNKGLRPKEKAEKKGKVGFIFSSIGSGAKGIFVWIAEAFVKRTKKTLHLVHFWLIKLKKGKKDDDMLREIEAKQELIMEEEKSLEKVINEDLAQTEVEDIAIFKEEKSRPVTFDENTIFVRQERSKQEFINIQEQPMKDRQIEQFFSEESEEDQGTEIPSAEQEFLVPKQEPKKQSFFKKLWKKKPEPEWQEEIYTFGTEAELTQTDEAQFSDGIVKKGSLSEGILKIEKKPLQHMQEDDRLIKEVVSVPRRNEESDPDEELGIDRKILEKKIIQKIAKNPKDVENYRQLGELYIKMKEFIDAEESYKQILKISPRDMDAKRKLEKIKLLKRLR